MPCLCHCLRLPTLQLADGNVVRCRLVLEVAKVAHHHLLPLHELCQLLAKVMFGGSKITTIIELGHNAF